MRSALWCCILVACICFGVATAATTVTFGQSAAFTGLNGQLGLEMRKVSTKFSGYPSAPACDTFVQGLLSAFKEVNDAGGIKGDLLFDLVSYEHDCKYRTLDLSRQCFWIDRIRRNRNYPRYVYLVILQCNIY
jgi:ABC-type multidrug transport system fused ATPase/permease subunit